MKKREKRNIYVSILLAVVLVMSGVVVPPAQTVEATDEKAAWENVLENCQYSINGGRWSSEDGAEHIQGMVCDDEQQYMYMSFTNMLAKVDMRTGTVVGTVTGMAEGNTTTGSHIGSMAYYEGKIYASLHYAASECNYIAVFDASKITGAVQYNDPGVMYALYLPQAIDKINDNDYRYAGGGIDAITFGKLPGGGYDTNGDGTVDVPDDKTYLFLAYGNITTPERYDNENFVIMVFDPEKITEENLLPFTEERVGQEETSSYLYEHKMFVYAGSQIYSIQNLEYDKTTGDFWLECYDRPEKSEFPSYSEYIIDGSVPLKLHEVEVGQSVTGDAEGFMPQAEAHAIAQLYTDYEDVDDDNDTEEQEQGWHATLKCMCEKGSLAAHEEVIYGATGHACKICGSKSQFSTGLISLGNDYFYGSTTIKETEDKINYYSARADLYQLNRDDYTFKLVEKPATYTVTTNRTNDLFISNKEAAVTGEVTLKYTVQRFENPISSWSNNGYGATVNPTGGWSYAGTNGSMLFQASNKEYKYYTLLAGYTYTITMKLAADGYISFTGSCTNGTETIDLTTKLTDSENDGANVGCKHFGIYLYGDENAVITNMSFTDKSGKDLGVQANRAECTIEKEEQEQVKYTVTKPGEGNFFLVNQTPAQGKVKLQYTVDSVSDSVWNNNGLMGTMWQNNDWPQLSGAVQFKTPENVMFQEGYTYTVVMEQDTEGNLSYSGSYTDGTTTKILTGILPQSVSYKTGVDYSYFGLYFDAEGIVRLTDVSCVDETGKNLGLKSNKSNCQIEQKESATQAYTVETEGEYAFYMYNKRPALGKVTMTYTVNSLSDSTPIRGNNGLIVTNNPTSRYPYTGGCGNMKYIYNSNLMLKEGYTYTVTMEHGADGYLHYSGSYTNGGDPIALDLWAPGDPSTSRCQYFGLFIGDTVTTRLTDVTFVDEAGNDLGAESNLSKCVIKPVKAERVRLYNAADFANYRTENDLTAPAKPGYRFAGWYTDEECTTVLDTDTTEGIAYAKFVDSDVLTVKAQVTTGTTAESLSTDISFIATVDSDEYGKVGFKITPQGGNTADKSSTTVYATLDTELDQLDFSTSSKYFGVYTYQDLGKDCFGYKFTVTPYWKTMDGTLVYGEAVETSVCELLGAQPTSQNDEAWNKVVKAILKLSVADVDCDGTISATDHQELLLGLVGLITDEECDVTGDSQVNAKDIVRLKKAIRDFENNVETEVLGKLEVQ